MFFLNFPTDVCLEGVEGRSGRILEEDAWILDGNFARTLPK